MIFAGWTRCPGALRRRWMQRPPRSNSIAGWRWCAAGLATKHACWTASNGWYAALHLWRIPAQRRPLCSVRPAMCRAMCHRAHSTRCVWCGGRWRSTPPATIYASPMCRRWRRSALATTQTLVARCGWRNANWSRCAAHPRLPVAVAAIYLAKRHYRPAIVALRAALAVAPTQLEANALLDLLAQTLLRAGNLREALRLFVLLNLDGDESFLRLPAARRRHALHARVY